MSESCVSPCKAYLNRRTLALSLQLLQRPSLRKFRGLGLGQSRQAAPAALLHRATHSADKCNPEPTDTHKRHTGLCTMHNAQCQQRSVEEEVVFVRMFNHGWKPSETASGFRHCTASQPGSPLQCACRRPGHACGQQHTMHRRVGHRQGAYHGRSKCMWRGRFSVQAPLLATARESAPVRTEANVGVLIHAHSMGKVLGTETHPHF